MPTMICPKCGDSVSCPGCGGGIPRHLLEPLNERDTTIPRPYLPPPECGAINRLMIAGGPSERWQRYYIAAVQGILAAFPPEAKFITVVVAEQGVAMADAMEDAAQARARKVAQS